MSSSEPTPKKLTVSLRKASTVALYTVSILLLLVAIVGSVFLGAAGISVGDVVAALFGGESLSENTAAIVLNVRLPRIVMGVLVGAMLAAAGATYQAVFRNPLADPYLLGVSAGAGLGVTVAIVFGATLGLTLGGVGVIIAAFVGGAVAVACTYLVSTGVGRDTDPTTVVLAGVAVAAFASAAQTYIQQRNIDTIQRIYTWMLGSLNSTTWSSIIALAFPVVLCCVILLLSTRVLDVMTLGDDEATALGANPQLIRLILVAVATLGTAAVVSVSGLIGFVGIVIPHAVRLVVGPAHARLVPLTMIWGAIFMVCADAIGRTVLAPAELPVGVITAFVGAPFFLFILRRHRGRNR